MCIFHNACKRDVCHSNDRKMGTSVRLAVYVVPMRLPYDWWCDSAIYMKTTWWSFWWSERKTKGGSVIVTCCLFQRNKNRMGDSENKGWTKIYGVCDPLCSIIEDCRFAVFVPPVSLHREKSARLIDFHPSLHNDSTHVDSLFFPIEGHIGRKCYGRAMRTVFSTKIIVVGENAYHCVFVLVARIFRSLCI